MIYLTTILNNISRYILLGLLSCLVLQPIALAEYGQPCASLPETIDSYLSSDTAYGIVKQNIDVESWATGQCDMPDDEFHICIKKPAPAMPADCEQHMIKIGDNVKLSAISSNPDFGGHPNLQDITLGVELIENLACLTMETSRGKKPLFCRTATSTIINDYTPDATCVSAGSACFSAEPKKSQSLFNFSGLAVECMITTLHTLFFLGENCMENEEFLVVSVSSFADFQATLRNIIFVALTLYVVLYGFNLALNPSAYAAPNQAAIAVLKIILVMYFAAGLGPITWQDGAPTQENGFTKLVMPFLIGATTEFAQMTFNSVDVNGLCTFDPDLYDNGYKFYALWDSLDCRISYYFGFAPLMNVVDLFSSYTPYNITDYGATGTTDTVLGSLDHSTAAKTGDFFLLALIWYMVLGGNFITVLCFGYIAFMLIIMTSNFVMLFVVCIITIYVMAYLSPIFITCYLFDWSRRYFESWLKIIISCALQPAVVGGVIALLFTMYDKTFFGNCPFRGYDYEIFGRKVRVFEMLTPDIDKSICENSFAYKMKRLYNGEGDGAINALFVKIDYISDTVGITLSAIYMIIMTMIIYYMFKSIFSFAADITNGPQVMAEAFALPSAKSKAEAGQKNGGASDNSASGGGGAADKVSSGGSGAADKVLSGGGGAADASASGSGGGK